MKIKSILLLSLWILQILALPLAAAFAEKLHEFNFKKNIFSSENKSVFFSFSKLKKMQTEMDGDDEIIINGKLFDIIKESEKGILCVCDDEEENIISAEKDCIQKNNSDNSTNKNHTIKLQLSDFYTLKNYNNFILPNSQFIILNSQKLYKGEYIKISSPPPEIFC